MMEGASARDPERTREAVLGAAQRAAQRLFARKGYALTSLKAIGEEAGVLRGTPSYFFGSKEGLYVAVKSVWRKGSVWGDRPEATGR